jgi:hypothetical protein
MRYVVDSNCFIESKNRYYAFDFCPAFWDWMEQQNDLGVVFSTEDIAHELMGLQDELADWAKRKGPTFFLPRDNAMVPKVTEIVKWARNVGFKTQAVDEFVRGADPFLVAYALAHGDTVVSHEKPNPNQRNRIKIPDVCQEFHVPYISLFDLLRQTGARFRI